MGVTAIWCQKSVNSCGWNMVVEEGQWQWLEHCVRRGSVAVAATWCQKSVNSCGWNMVVE